MNRIWSQAGIFLELEGIFETAVPQQVLDAVMPVLVPRTEFFNDPRAVKMVKDAAVNTKQPLPASADPLFDLSEHLPTGINLYLVRWMSRTNARGLARQKAIFLSDETSVNDFRAASTALGFLLGIQVDREEGNLMVQGRNGEKLSEAQIETARDRAATFFCAEIPSVSGTRNQLAAGMERLVLPVVARLVDGGAYYTSSRLESGVREWLFPSVDTIFSQAGIGVRVADASRVSISEAVLQQAMVRNQWGEFKRLFPPNPNAVQAFFVRLVAPYNGMSRNGFALTRERYFFLADDTGNSGKRDPRCTAHEMGHVLGLNHVAPVDRLMAPGKNGQRLDEMEIRTARVIAREIADA